jgi:hypothetical protein
MLGTNSVSRQVWRRSSEAGAHSKKFLANPSKTAWYGTNLALCQRGECTEVIRKGVMYQR